jgi:hypothetical protein
LKSILEKLLIAALELEEAGRKPFSAEDIVVASWRRFPDAFGLVGYQDKYPDSNRVFAEIMGSKPIRKKGYLIKVGEKLYQLTDSGKQYAKSLTENRVKRETEKGLFTREIKKELKKYFESRALAKYKENRSSEITFYDLCALFSISPRSSYIELEGKLSNFNYILAKAQEIASKKAFSFEHGGKEYNLSDIEMLIKLKEFLLKEFEYELNVIRQRRDERNK